jgi:hypothetical protein
MIAFPNQMKETRFLLYIYFIVNFLVNNPHANKAN